MIRLKIITPEKVVYEDEVKQATLSVSSGEVTILPNHRSYIASLKPGEIVVKKEEGEEIDLAVSGGFVEFHNNELVVLADEAERAEDIDLKKAEEARKRAEELKKRKYTDENEYAKVVASLEKELAWTRAARRYLKRKGL